MTKLSFDMIKLMTAADAVVPTQDGAVSAGETATTGPHDAIASSVSTLGESSQTGDDVAAQDTNISGDQTMTLISKARANRTIALRVHALRSASVTNLFAADEASVAADRQESDNDNTRRMIRSLPRFVSQRAIAQPFAA